MTYKWTLDEVDRIELPMLHVLLAEIGETPPQDLLASGQMKAMLKKAEQDKKAAIGALPRVSGKVRRRKDGE